MSASKTPTLCGSHAYFESFGQYLTCTAPFGHLDNHKITWQQTPRRVEVIAPPIPDIVGTIVRDKDGDAWQRHEAGWYSAGAMSSRSIDELHDDYGPLTVLWTPEDQS